jgi:hypothetical protein
MKTFLKIITILMLLTASIAGLYITRFELSAVVIPVEDGVVIINPNNDEEYLHISLLNNKSLLSDKTNNVLGIDASPEKNLQFPIYPSYQESYYTNKSFSSYLSKSTIEMIVKPQINKDSIKVSEQYTLTNSYPVITGLEIMDKDIKITQENSNLILTSRMCALTVTSSGDYYEEEGRVIWYKSDKDKITFEIAITCQK